MLRYNNQYSMCLGLYSSSEDDAVPERRAISPRSPVEDDGVSSNSDTSSSNEAEPVQARTHRGFGG